MLCFPNKKYGVRINNLFLNFSKKIFAFHENDDQSFMLFG